MGFYGNISNIGKTNMTFDIIYPNRFVMDNNVNEDGVYAGRYVLIEYDTNYARDTFIRFWVNSEQNNQGTGVDAYYADSTKTIQMNFKEGPIYERMNTADSSSGLYYRCIDEESQTIELLTNAFNYPKFMIYKEYQFDVSAEIDPQGHRKEYDAKKDILYIKIDGKGYFPATSVRNSYSSSRTYYLKEKDYTINYNKDIEEYGASYDSSVWVKQYEDGVAKYVRIAELNSVVPTFDVSVDAPTMIPQSPHFDADSTNIYYNLHVQPQWGFRIKEAEKNDNGETIFSDATTEYTSITYDENGAEIITSTNIDADIYFNKAGFHKDEKNAYVNLEDSINITSTGVSGQLYNSHKKGEPKKTAPDIQELSIHLPSIGNMMSDAWDIIHGPERDDSPIDSLQGRLNFFQEIDENEIPVQSPGNYLVGSTIKNDTWVSATINIPNTSNLPNTDKNKYHVEGIALTHKTVDGFKDSQNNTMTNQSPSFGSSFNIPVITVDKAGHITSLDGNSSVQLPQGSLTINDETNNVSKVITDLSFVAEDGDITAKTKNVGELLLTGYQQNENGYIAAQNSINTAFKVLDAQAQKYNNNIAAINDVDNGILAQAKSYADGIKTAILGEGIKDTFDTLVKIQNWIEGDGVNATELTEEMAKIPSWAKESTKPIYTAEEVGALSDTTIIPTKLSELTNDAGYLTEKTLEDKIADLEKRIAKLENPTTTE